MLQLPVLRDAGLAKLHQRTAQTLQAAAGAQSGELAAPPAGGSLVHFLTQAGKYFGKDPTKWEAVGQGKVCSEHFSKTCLHNVLAALLSCNMLWIVCFYNQLLEGCSNDSLQSKKSAYLCSLRRWHTCVIGSGPSMAVCSRTTHPTFIQRGIQETLGP